MARKQKKPHKVIVYPHKVQFKLKDKYKGDVVPLFRDELAIQISSALMAEHDGLGRTVYVYFHGEHFIPPPIDMYKTGKYVAEMTPHLVQNIEFKYTHWPKAELCVKAFKRGLVLNMNFLHMWSGGPEGHVLKEEEKKRERERQDTKYLRLALGG